LIAWLLKELEKNPTSLFRKKDLLKKSKKQFEELKRQGFLTYVQPDPHHETYPCTLACLNTCPMDVVEMEGELFAICPKDTEIDPITLKKDDLSRYAFSIDRLLEQIRTANKLGGSFHRINGVYSYIGYKTYDGNRVGFVFIPKIADVSMLELSGLNQLCEDDDILVVLTPASKIEDVSLKGMLRAKKIVQSSLVSSVNLQTFELPIETLISGILKPKTEQKITPVREPTSIRIAKAVRKFQYVTSEVIAKAANTTAGTVRNNPAWKKRKEIWGERNKPRKGSKDEIGTMRAYGTQADTPQAEHYDIYQMFQDYKSGKTAKPPTLTQIANMLSTDDDIVSVERAKELLKEAQKLLNFEPNRQD